MKMLRVSPNLLITLFFSCTLAGCAKVSSPPRLIQGLPNQIYQIEPAFDQRLKSMFPAGSDENALRAELVSEGFQIKASEYDTSDSESMRHAYYENTDIACRYDWLVSWSAESGKIASISGRFRDTCL